MMSCVHCLAQNSNAHAAGQHHTTSLANPHPHPPRTFSASSQTPPTPARAANARACARLTRPVGSGRFMVRFIMPSLTFS